MSMEDFGDVLELVELLFKKLMALRKKTFFGTDASEIGYSISGDRLSSGAMWRTGWSFQEFVIFGMATNPEPKKPFRDLHS